jgi:hypothetical protein
MKRYGVQYVLAGHVHQMIRATLDGIEYVSMPSAGGHMRGMGGYEDGWFFGYAVVDVKNATAAFALHELGSEHATTIKDWGLVGLVHKTEKASPAHAH